MVAVIGVFAVNGFNWQEADVQISVVNSHNRPIPVTRSEVEQSFALNECEIAFTLFAY